MHREHSAFRTWMQTGLWPYPELAERKFNPWHDPDDGRFTFSGQGNHFGQGGSARPEPTPRSTPPGYRATAGSPGPSPRAMRRYIEHVRREARERDAFRKRMVPIEGDRNNVYLDSKGIPTVGIGHKVTRTDGLKVGDRITDAQKVAFWEQDSKEALDAAKRQMREAGITDPDFLPALADVNFQLGTRWELEHRETWRLIKARQYAAAAKEAEDSDWFRDDTPNRVRAFQAALMRLERAERSRRSHREAVPTR